MSSLLKKKVKTLFLDYLNFKYSTTFYTEFKIPKIKKIVIHRSIAKDATNKTKFIASINELKLITGQLPKITLSKKKSSKFKQKKGIPVGLKVTLRKELMYYFMEKLILFVLPRELNFKGILETSFDKQGNFNLGIKSHSSFLELDTYLSYFKNGYNINIIFETSYTYKKYNKIFLEFLGIPFI
uniref:Ribosomal protein L5 n=1 Tax=Apicomplexa sp. corallicolid ex Leiopathes glaberrima TaxID=2720216 RepID=A0A6M3R9T3_9APIC|nr:ribosomal protein L5 [Apicomplexa sp. corallicolid ex Leiopathes glaberrima]